MSKRTPVDEALKGIDTAGRALRKELDALWVPWSPETDSGHVYWHAAAASDLIEGLNELAALEAKIQSWSWPGELHHGS